MLPRLIVDFFARRVFSRSKPHATGASCCRPGGPHAGCAATRGEHNTSVNIRAAMVVRHAARWPRGRCATLARPISGAVIIIPVVPSGDAGSKQHPDRPSLAFVHPLRLTMFTGCTENDHLNDAHATPDRRCTMASDTNRNTPRQDGARDPCTEQPSAVDLASHA